MKIEYSKSLSELPPYLFIEIDRIKAGLVKAGHDVINLGVGDPDLPTPPEIVEAMKKALEERSNHQYPFGSGKLALRKKIAEWSKKRFGVNLSPENEICAVIGSKEGIGHFPFAFVNPGDYVLCPSPGYPVYANATKFAGGIPYFMPLLEKNNFLPDFSLIPEKVASKAKIMFLNYPNNPTAAVCSRKFFEEAVTFAKKYGIIIAHDAAYSEVYFDKPPISFLEVSGARDIGIEFHSFSKTFNMTGWRIGWAAGNPDIVKGLAKVKDNFDSGVFGAVQDAAIFSFSIIDEFTGKMRKIYLERRDILAEGLNASGFEVKKPQATFYLWAKIKGAKNSSETVKDLMTRAFIVCTPGNGLGEPGEGYVRFALTVDAARMKEAVSRLKTKF